MTCFGDLPELVVIGVFGYLHYDSRNSFHNIKKRLPLIAINRNWREYGLPLLYGTLIFEYSMEKTKPPNSLLRVSQNSNVGLFRGVRYCNLVNTLVICCRDDSYGEPQFEGVLQEFTISLINLLFPGVSCNPFSSTTNTFLTIWIGNREKQENAETMVPGVVARFVDMFPNINHLDIDFDGFDTASEHLAKEISSTLQPSLISFRCEFPDKFSYLSYPNNARNFNCGSKQFTVSYFPKQCDKEKLESLVILNPISNFAWQERNQPNKYIVFPNLKRLTLDCHKNNTTEISFADKEHSKIGVPEFPKLRYLKLHISNKDGLVFVPAIISTRLDKLVLSGNALAILAFEMVQVKSVGYVEMDISGDHRLVTDVFYQTTNRLFRDTKITHCSSVRLSGEITELDLQRIHWKHVDRLELCDAGFNRIVDWLIKLTALKSLVVTYNSNRPNQGNEAIESQILNRLEGCKLQKLTVNNKVAGDSSNYVVDVTMGLIKSLKKLKRVYISKREGPDVWLAFHEERLLNLHFEDIELLPIKDTC